MERYSVDYHNVNRETSDRHWEEWLKGKEHLHMDTIAHVKKQWKNGGCSLVLERPLTKQNWVDAHIQLRVEVGFTFEKAEPMTKTYSGSPASLEVNEIKLGELILPLEAFDEVMKQVRDEIEETCWDEIETQTLENR